MSTLVEEGTAEVQRVGPEQRYPEQFATLVEKAGIRRENSRDGGLFKKNAGRRRSCRQVRSLGPPHRLLTAAPERGHALIEKNIVRIDLDCPES